MTKMRTKLGIIGLVMFFGLFFSAYIYPTIVESQQNATAVQDYLHTVQFSEYGLPNGASWSVIVDGTAKSSTTSTILVNLNYGYHTFSISPPSGYNITSINSNLLCGNNQYCLVGSGSYSGAFNFGELSSPSAEISFTAS